MLLCRNVERAVECLLKRFRQTGSIPVVSDFVISDALARKLIKKLERIPFRADVHDRERVCLFKKFFKRTAEFGVDIPNDLQLFVLFFGKYQSGIYGAHSIAQTTYRLYY